MIVSTYPVPIYLSICLFVSQSIIPSSYQCNLLIDLPIGLSIHLSIHLSILLSIHSLIHVSIHLFIHLFFSPHTHELAKRAASLGGREERGQRQRGLQAAPRRRGAHSPPQEDGTHEKVRDGFVGRPGPRRRVERVQRDDDLPVV